MIKACLRGAVFLPVLFLTACSSFTFYRETDCNYTPEHYGQCYADMGYNTIAYESLAKYCSERGKNLNIEKFKKTHEARLKEICSQPEEVFRLSFRQSTRASGPQACPASLLATDELKRAAMDGIAAGYAYKGAAESEQKAKEAEEEQRLADDNGLGTALENRITKLSPEDHYDRAKSENKRYQTILAKYPKANNSYLTETLKCTAEGIF